MFLRLSTVLRLKDYMFCMFVIVCTLLLPLHVHTLVAFLMDQVWSESLVKMMKVPSRFWNTLKYYLVLKCFVRRGVCESRVITYQTWQDHVIVAAGDSEDGGRLSIEERISIHADNIRIWLTCSSMQIPWRRTVLAIFGPVCIVHVEFSFFADFGRKLFWWARAHLVVSLWLMRPWTSSWNSFCLRKQSFKTLLQRQRVIHGCCCFVPWTSSQMTYHVKGWVASEMCRNVFWWKI